MKKRNLNEYVSEADVESKFVYSILLREILEIPSELISLHVPIKITQGRKTETKEADVLIKRWKQYCCDRF